MELKLNRKEYIEMLIDSLKNDPESWEYDNFRIYNYKINSNIWVANGLPYIEIQYNDDIGDFFKIYSKFCTNNVKLNLLQSFIIHLLYLRKVRKRSLIYITLRYMILGIMGIIITPIIIISNNWYNYTGDAIINVSKDYYREYRLSKLLDKLSSSSILKN